MSSEILLRIHTRYNQFSENEKRIADYICRANRRTILYMSISELAAETQTSEAGIVRFCQKLDLKGFQDFRIQLAEAGLPKERKTDQSKVASEDLTGRLLMRYNHSLEMTFHAISQEQINQIVLQMSKARHICLFGIGVSFVAASAAQRHLMTCFPQVQLSPTLDAQQHDAEQLTQDDLAIVFSVSGATRGINTIAHRLKRRNVPIVVLTGYQNSPLTQYASAILLTCDNTEQELPANSLSTLINQLAAVDMICQTAMQEYPEISKKNARALAQLLAKQKI